MSTSLKWITLIGVSVLVGVLLVAMLAVTTLAQRPDPWEPRGSSGSDGYGPDSTLGGWGGYGSGMMGGMGPGMMGGWGYGYPDPGSRLTLDQAAETVQRYLATYGDPDLVVVEVMEFTNNFYAQVGERSTGIHAFELLVNPYSEAVYPEPGPNMMWNTRYSHMGGRGGMMGGRWGYGSQSPAVDMSVSPEQALGYAQRYLNSYLPGTTIADEADAFYGYYTLHVLRDGQVVGMLSVNGYTGQVWYHTWHGDFIGMIEGHEE